MKMASANKSDGFLKALQLLCQNDKLCSKACSKFIRLNDLTNCDIENLLCVLASLLLSPQQTLIVAAYLSDALPNILSVALGFSNGTSLNIGCSPKLLHEKRCVALGKLITIRPDLVIMALKYFNGNPSPFYEWNLSEIDSEPQAKKMKMNSSLLYERVSDEEIALCCLSFVKIKTDYFRDLWNWSLFMTKFLNHQDPYVQWLACQSSSLVLKMSNLERDTLLASRLSENEIIEFSVKCSIEESIIKENYAKISVGNGCKDSQCFLPYLDCGTVTSIGGISLLSVSRVPSDFESNLVLVNSTQTNLQAIALGIATGKTLCLQGPVGCGKTALVEHLAKLTGRSSPPLFLSVQLGDQTDSKMLLGTYQCTDIPGEFVWKAGVLTQAVVGGYWLLLEDIDSCTTDVAAVLASLLETGNLNVPGYKDSVCAAPGFQLFLTQRLISSATGFHKLNAGSFGMLQHHCLTVQMEPLSQGELVEIVKTLYPSLKTVACRIVDVFLLFSAGSHHTSLTENEAITTHESTNAKIQRTGARLPSTRDLIKWCTRSCESFNVSSPESGLKLFQDAVDIFCFNVSNSAMRLELAQSIAAKLGIVHTKAEYFCNVYKPVISFTPSHILAGRITLPRRQGDTAALRSGPRTTFSFTRPAAALLERIASCISHCEPVLLVGETGVGKTSSIQYLAHQMGQSLSVINMNQQSDSADLLGGYKPVELKFIMSPIRDEFETLFRKFFSVNENAKFLNHIAHCFSLKKWATLLSLMKHSTTAALKRFDKKFANVKLSVQDFKPDDLFTSAHKNDWLQLSLKLRKVEVQLRKSQNALAFAFVEGSLVRALKKGQWVLLDEINLASAQTLECLSSLLEGSTGSLYLLERGDNQSISRHPDFRIFAAMNPATDVGKRELPPGIRNRFTEFYVDELVNRQDLLLLCGSYLAPLALPATKLEALVKFYLCVCQEAAASLSDGTGQKPHFSLRTLCRALAVAAANPCGSVPRSLFEGLLLSFLTQLDRSSHPIVENMVAKAVVGKATSESLIKQPIPVPIVAENSFVQIEGYWVTRGPLQPITSDKYILTKTVRQNLRDLVRVVSLARLPVLLQGETSVGKTSLITYLAQASGNRCLRINNHEHTDLQEYVGAYAADEHGNLVFKEGVLVEAMRCGHWVILDELNLAPSDVLEALNRVLDDNRELFIPETQKVVKAHPNFMLFATQNPPGLYGGRKVLSRAFRNRFIELHFEEISPKELETILHLRCDLPPTYCKKMVAVMSDLQVKRKGSAAFAGKQGFITLRDLFRWGERYRLAQNQTISGKFYDWDQHIADEGYLILAGRVRKDEERVTIQDALKKHINRSVNPMKLFTLNEETSSVTRSILESFVHQTPPGFDHIVWTYNIRRLAVLLGKACEFKEPILLVGETGCGKTTLCQLLAASRNQDLATVNCHMHSESADFLGGLRPVREQSEEKKGKLFEWVDGPLIEAMLEGCVFLADEISLADDSVLERLNSLLEPERKLLLAEKGSSIVGDPCEVTAKDGFIFVGTMNPGGDYGKKELSPALRNRFTEIWCEGCSNRSDLIAVIEHNLTPELVFRNAQNCTSSVGAALVDFLEWFSATELGNRVVTSIRDVMTWVKFINTSTSSNASLDLGNAYIHGACLTFLDSLGTGVTSFTSREEVQSLRVAAVEFLRKQVIEATGMEPASLMSYLTSDSDDCEVISTVEKFGIKPFFISRGLSNVVKDTEFLLSAPTTRINCMRVLRGLQLGKALLLEGSPGVGKTSLVDALAHASGHHLIRINLSDQTDIADLFGADLPVEGGKGGEFAWRDGPFLQALRSGHWILLDELNLASQSVLEGLNAVLDHRGDLFIPELGRTFHIQSEHTRLFACQNPLNQGGARKGLPQSFLNRFTQVYMETLTIEDLEFICKTLYPTLPITLIQSMVKFNQLASSATTPGGKWGQRGAPWEMNLRDLCRWCEVTVWGSSNGALNPGRFVQLIYVDRMRTLRDKEEMMALYSQILGSEYPLCSNMPHAHITPGTLYLGDVTLARGSCGKIQMQKLLLRHQLPLLQSLARCVSLGWLSIIVGPSGCGKTSLVHLLAQLAGRELRTLSVNSAMDTTEILGGFEQTDYKRHLDEISVKVQKIMTRGVQNMVLSEHYVETNKLFSLWEIYMHLSEDTHEASGTTDSEVNLFCQKIEALENVLRAVPGSAISSQELQELKIILEKLDSLKKCAKQDNSLNAGGKFEWVDSVLVKSLQDGCWLLVDNVNLCSAAVLDRLNGLLEPNGVLTISERGVNSNGELVTIRPHHNFRLFLAMDTKYGEISRAMRNRGVEIYVATCEGDLTKSLPPVDQAALLYDIGISSHSEQQLLLHVHQSMSNSIPGPDPPGLSDLLHASFLYVQQVRRGMPSISSLVSSFTKVYIQSRLCDSIGVKRHNLSVLEASVQKEVQAEVSNVLDKFIIDSTLKTGELYIDSRFATVKQRCAILSAVACAQEHELNAILAFLEIPNTKMNFQMVQKNLVILFYQICSIADVSLGHKWLLKKVAGSSHALTISQLSEILHNALIRVGDLAESHLIWDRRWLPDVSAAISKQSGIDDQGVENRVALLLHFIANTICNEQAFQFKISKKHKKLSVLEYSYAVSEGSLANNLSLDPFYIEIGPCLKLIRTIMNDSLNTIGVLVNDDLWWSIRKALNWTNRLQRQAETLFVSSDRNSAAETLNLLAVHFRWFMKHAFSIVVHLAREADLDVHPFCETVEKMNLSVFSNNSILWHIAKRLRNEMGQPLPMASEHQALLSLKASSLNSALNMWSGMSVKDNLVRLAHFLLTAEGFQAKTALIAALKELATSLEIEKVEDRLLQVEKLCSKMEISSESSKISEVDQSDHQLKTMEMLLWPFQEAVVLNMADNLLTSLLKGEHPSSMHKISALTDAMRRIPSVPPAFIAFFEAFHVEKCAHELSRGIYWLFQLSSQSLAVTKFRNWVPCDINNANEVMAIQEHLPQHCPILSRLSANLLFCHLPSNKEQLSVSSLEQHADHSKLLHSLRTMFWRNADSFCNPHYSYRANETKKVVCAAQHFISSLEKICCLTSEQTFTLQGRVASIVEHFECKLGSKSSALVEFYGMLFEVVNIVIFVEKSPTEETETLKKVGLLWAYLGCLESQLFSAFPQIDPTSKHAIKLQYTKEEILSTKSELIAAQIMSSVRGNCSPPHPHFKILGDHVNELDKQLAILSRHVAVRPEPSLYSTLIKEMHHFANSLSSTAVVSNLTKRLMSIGSISSLVEAKMILKEAQTWLHSQNSFRTMFEKRFGIWYPDMAYPLLASNAKLCRGIELLVGTGKKICYCGLKGPLSSTLTELICSFGAFPTMYFEQPSLLALVSNLTDKGIAITIEQALFALREVETLDIREHSEMEAYWLLKSAVMELKNYLCLSESCRTEEWNALIGILRRFMSIWQKQETERRERELDNESLYKSRGAVRCQTVTDDEQVDKEIAEMFPSMRENDFGDLEPSNSLDDAHQDTAEQSRSGTLNIMLNDEDITFVSSVHMSLVLAYTKSMWFDSHSHGFIPIGTDFLTPWIQRCAVAARLVSMCSPILDDHVDRSLLPSWIQASYLATAEPEDCNKVVSMSPEDPSYDFYRTSCLSEVKQCKPVLHGLLERVKELLCEWPEHPTLNQIVLVINRISSFPISSPVSRFLTGMEILLNKTKEWEENAHSGVSLAIQTTAVTNLIIQWRRLELNSWKGCLNSAALNIQSRASRWWFYVFSLIEAHLSCDPSAEGALRAKDLVSTLERFMEEAPLGEFEKRLNILLAFHCHLINMSSSHQQRELLCILWNLHGFYSQFKDMVASRIAELKAPIEKKLKDYVKIARWNDINYWAVKEAVFKTQRTLHRHIKEFEVVLKQPARSTMLSSRLEGKGPNRRGFAHINPHVHVVKSDYQHCIKDAVGLDMSLDSSFIVCRAGSFFNRSKKLTKEIILSSTFPGLIAALDEFANDIVVQVQQLATLEVDRSIPKSKQVSQAKNQLQMKRKALADLFRTLQQIGLSHYTGLTYDESHLKFEFTQLPPLDMCALMKSLSKAMGSSLSLADKEILNVWDGCSSYFMRSWARYVQLCLALRDPHKDNGPSNIERLRGFPAHLLVLTHDLHKEVNGNANLLAQMQMNIFHLESFLEHLSEPIPCQNILCDWNNRLQTLLATSSVTLHQFRLLLDTCPENQGAGTVQENIPVIDDNAKHTSSVLRAVKGEIYWEQAVDIVGQVLSSLSECKEKVNDYNFNCSSKTKRIFTVRNFKNMRQCYKDVFSMAENLASLLKVFVMDSSFHPCTSSLRWLIEHMHKECQMFSEMCDTSLKTSALLAENGSTFKNISCQVNDLMQNVLLAIQSIYKSYTTLDEPSPNESNKEVEVEAVDQLVQEVESDSDLQEKHLSNGILRSLQCDFRNLSVLDISRCLQSLVDNLLNIINVGGQSSHVEKCVRFSVRAVPLLRQWLLLYQFVLQQQVAAYRASSKLLSVLLAVFGDVTVKGFCTPEDVLSGEEAGDGDGQADGKQQGSMGLGDGEGEKDVSERIESEDQLDDARPAGEEKKDEDKDCKEEEEGIEMSDNFDGKLQDVDPKGDENDEDDKDEDEHDAEKEMGDTEKDADQLDEQIWGSDSEEENSGDEGQKDEEEGNAGEKTGEKEVGARENEAEQNDKDNHDNDENKDGGNREESKPEVNEMKEPEVDDDQVDPYHGNMQPEAEPDPLELPDDLQLDDGDNKENEETNDENPFDIDEMKEQMPPEPQPEENDKESQKDTEQELSESEGSDDDDDPVEASTDKGELDEPGNDEEENENIDSSDERKDGIKQDDIEEENNVDKEDEKRDLDERNPSKDDPTSEQTEASEDNHQGSKDQVASSLDESQQTSGEQPPEDADGDPGGEERDAVGQAPTNQELKGHHSDRSGKRPQRDQQNQRFEEEEKRQRPGHSDNQRSLGDVSEPLQKRLKTVDIKQAEETEAESISEDDQDMENPADLYQHIKDVKEQSTMQTLDAATEEQAEQQPVINNDDEEQASLPEDEAMDVDNDEMITDDKDGEKKHKDETTQGCKKNKQRKEQEKGPSQEEHDDTEKGVEVDGERIDTLCVSRGPDTTFHTQYKDLALPNIVSVAEVQEQYDAVRKDLQDQLASWNQEYAGEEASKAWQLLSSLTNSLARDLSEQLRLVLEPTQATRMKGDFRTGRRINMRKVIPYIASQFRKDKIWMRRTKPSKREYQIVLAIDDSSSMADNRSKELAFESLALVSQALTILEVGDLGVLSYGETVKVLHKLGEPFTQYSGARLLQQFLFEQRKTQIGKLVDFVTALFATCKVQTSAEHAQLLVVISDGQGIFSEGQDKVFSCVRKARLAGIFMVFVIIDNPENKRSVLDIGLTKFKDGKVEISPYMDSFPFPFYLILRDISNLPSVLSDALRQWFELVSNE